MRRSFAVIVLLLSLVAGALTAPSRAAAARDAGVTVVNSDATGPVSRFDVDGNALDAHDGSVLRVGNLFYLYGTSYACGYRYQQNSTFCGFKAYSSSDLVRWTDRGYIVPPSACQYCFRPHVVYNAATRRYVMWADGGGHYLVATSPTPTGLFTAQPDPTPAVGGAVDESLFVDTDGTGYLIHNTTQVAAGLTADMVVERLTPDYLNTTGRYVRLGLGDVEAFTVFKRNGVYHALMSDPTCAYCSGGTGEMTATSMLGTWSGAWYDPNGVHQSGRAEPRWRARLVNDTSCGGQPLASFPVTDSAGRTTYLFMSDRWNDRAPNESLANFYIGPMAFDSSGVLQGISCVDSFAPGLPGVAAATPAGRDQGSGVDGFHHYCDVAGNVTREQAFTPSRTGKLNAASVTSFQSGSPNAALTLSIVDAETGTVLNRSDFDSVPWAPTVLTAHPGTTVVDGHRYLLRLSSATTTGCYGWEYNDTNAYASGEESYSTDNSGSFTVEPGRDLKFTTDVDDYPDLAAAFDNAAVSPAADPGAAHFDGTGHSLIAEDLAAAGWNPGAAVTVNGTPLQFPSAAPGTPDNVIADGQRIALHGSGTALSFLVTSTGTATSGSGVIDYADGTSQSYQLAAPDWYFGPTDAKTVSVPRWNAPGGPALATMKLFTLVVPLRPGVPVARVTLPKVSDGVSQPTMHVFALGIRPGTGPWAATWANGIDDSLAPWTWTDRTLRMVEHTSVGGSAVRIRLDNSFGPAPITVGHATIAVQKAGAVPVSNPVTLTFGGAQSVTMPSGGQAVSDGLPFAVPADTNLLVTLYLKGAVTYAPMHTVASQDMYSTNDGTGDHAADGATFPVNNLFGFWTVLAGIDISGASTVVAFGDSITDGYDSSQNSNSRWPDFLARRLPPTGPAVVDEGISGNRILTDAFTGMPDTGSAGVSALSRLDRDLVTQSGVRTAIVLEGINDINGGAMADQVIAGLKQMAATIHAAHLRVLVGTLTPIAGCGCGNDQHIAYRDQVNAFIRANGGVFDGVVDFDAAVRDPANPEAMLAAYDSGDHLHPNDAGYRAMAGAVPLSAL